MSVCVGGGRGVIFEGKKNCFCQWNEDFIDLCCTINYLVMKKQYYFGHKGLP